MGGPRESLFAHTCWWQWTGELRSLLPTTSRCGQGISLGSDRKWYEFQKHRLQGALHVISTGSAGMRAVSTWA